MPKMKANTEVRSKNASARSVGAFKVGVLDPAFIELGLDSGERDYGNVEARIARVLQDGVRQYVDPESGFEAQLKINYWRLLKAKHQPYKSSGKRQ